jgi:hypothetical protein
MKKYLIIATAVLAGVGCKKILDVNVNPNTPTLTDSRYVFTNALNRTAAFIDGGAHITSGSWVGFYAHSTSFTGGGQEKTYVFTNGDFDFFDGTNATNGGFDNLADYQYVVNSADKDGVSHLKGPAKIMQCMIFQKLIDFYGNIPYTEALKGTNFPTPKYDDAKTIYESLLAKLTEAIADINAATWPVNETSDIYFKGDKTQWKKLANTIRLRLIIRMSNVTGFSPAATITAITSEGSGFITSPVLCQPGYLKSSGKLNPYYQNYGFNESDAPTGDFRKMNSVMVNWLINSNDLFRLGRICSIKGNPNNDLPISTNPADFFASPLGGEGAPYLSSNVSAMGRMQIIKGQATLPAIVITDAEAKFLQAEAIQRGWMAGNAGTMYASGVTAAFRLAAAIQFPTASATTAASDAAAAAYLASTTAPNGVYLNYDSAVVHGSALKSIWVQKWVGLCNVDGEEAWSEYRRTNSPTNLYGNCPTSPKSVAVGGGPEPVRLYYPLREESVNGTNVPQSINVFSSRIFWDIN